MISKYNYSIIYSALTVIYWISPEILMVLSSSVILILLKRLVRGHLEIPTNPTASLETPVRPIIRFEEDTNKDNLVLLTKLAKCLSVATLCLAAVLQPSVLSAVYFFIFLGSATWWGCYKELNR